MNDGCKQRSTLRFIALLAAIYLAFEWIYFYLPDTLLATTVYPALYTRLSDILINFISVSEGAIGRDNIISSPIAQLEIVRGCDGAGAAFLLSAAMLAYTAPPRRKVIGIVSGLTLIYALNLIRIVGLYFVVGYMPEWYLPAHTYFAPLFLILISCLYFAWWTTRSGGQSIEHQ